jgi:hypothetical protein
MPTKHETVERIDDTLAAKMRVVDLLEPCFTDPPTAAAVIVVNSDRGTEFFNINMDTLEMITTLMNTGIYMQRKYYTHDTPETLQ